MPFNGRLRFCLRPKTRRSQLDSESSEAYLLPYIDCSVLLLVSLNLCRGFEVPNVLRGVAKLGVRKSRFSGLARQVAGLGIGCQRCAYVFLELEVQVACAWFIRALFLLWVKANPAGFALVVKKQCSDWDCRYRSKVEDGAVAGNLARIAVGFGTLKCRALRRVSEAVGTLIEAGHFAIGHDGGEAWLRSLSVT